MGKDKNISCPACTKKYSDMGAAWVHIQQKHPETQLSPKAEGASLPNTIFGPAAAAADGSSGNNLTQPLGTGPIVLQLSYSLSGGSPWRILNHGRLRIFHHRELPETGSSGVDVDRIRGLPGKTQTIFNTVVNEVDNSVRRTQAIILSLSREAAQTIYALVSAFAASLSITTHLSLGKSDIKKDKEGLQERPHIVIGTLGRIAPMLECKAINPTDVRILCVDNVQYFLSVGYEKEFSGFCGHLSKDINAIFLSTSIQYKSSHDLSKLFTHEPLHFLVKEGLAPEPSDILRDPEPAATDSNLIEDATLGTIRPVSGNSVVSGIHGISLERFYCQEYDCGRGFSSKVHLDSHTRFYHPQKPTQATERVEEATTPSGNIFDAEDLTNHSPVYFSPRSNVSSLPSGGLATEGGSGHAETDAPVLHRERDQYVKPNVPESARETHESIPEQPTTIQGGNPVTQVVAASTPLSLRCRMCDAPPTVGARPTVTTCGHLFCSECITQRVMSTSKCPVCDNALLLYCLFKLDLPVLS